jgi:hypothetical protein
MADKKKRSTPDWIKNVVPDPSTPPNTIMVRGYFGDAPTEDDIRIYLSENLDQYVDVADDAIYHAEPADTPGMPPGLHYIWIDRDADMQHEPLMQPQTGRKQKFLEGRIQRNYARQVNTQPGGQAQMQPQQQIPASQWFCPPPSQYVICNLPTRICPSLVDGCQSQQYLCPPPSQYVICERPPLRTMDCPSAVDACPSAPAGCYGGGGQFGGGLQGGQFGGGNMQPGMMRAAAQPQMQQRQQMQPQQQIPASWWAGCPSLCQQPMTTYRPCKSSTGRHLLTATPAGISGLCFMRISRTGSGRCHRGQEPRLRSWYRAHASRLKRCNRRCVPSGSSIQTHVTWTAPNSGTCF